MDLRQQANPATPSLVAVFIHGGGFCAHTATEYPFAGEALPRLAAALGASKGRRAIRVLALDYGLAPEVRRGRGRGRLFALLEALTKKTMVP